MTMVKRTLTVSEQLRDAIVTAGITRYRIAKDTGVNQAALSRFIRGITSLDLITADKLCAYLRLELSEKSGRNGR
jgi:transcriptional regulator with XRE-family HTH domain